MIHFELQDGALSDVKPPFDVHESFIDSSTSSSRRVLEQYMKNQLELNSEEIEQYEVMINDLLKKLESSEEIADQLRLERDEAVLRLESFLKGDNTESEQPSESNLDFGDFQMSDIVLLRAKSPQDLCALLMQREKQVCAALFWLFETFLTITPTNRFSSKLTSYISSRNLFKIQS